MVIVLEDQFIIEVLQYIHSRKDLITFQFVNKKVMRLYKTILSNPLIDMSTVGTTLNYYTLVRTLFPKTVHFNCPFDFSVLSDNEIMKFNKCSLINCQFPVETINNSKMITKGVVFKDFKKQMPLLEIVKQHFTLESLNSFVQNISNFPSLKYIEFIIDDEILNAEKILISSIITVLNTIQNVKICICYEIENDSDFIKIETIRKSLPARISHVYNYIVILPDQYIGDKEKEEEITQYKFVIPMISKLPVTHFVDFLEKEDVANEYLKYFFPLELKGHIADMNLQYLTTITKITTDCFDFKLKLPKSCVSFEDINDIISPTTERKIENMNELAIKRMRTAFTELIPLTLEELEIPFAALLHCPSSLTKLVIGQIDKKDEIVFNGQLKSLSIGEYPKTLALPTTLTDLKVATVKNKLSEGIQELEIGKLKKAECAFIPQSVTSLTVLCGTTFDLRDHPNIKNLVAKIAISNSIFKSNNYLVSEKLEALSIYIAGKVTKKKKATFLEEIKACFSHVKNLTIDADFKQVISEN